MRLCIYIQMHLYTHASMLKPRPGASPPAESGRGGDGNGPRSPGAVPICACIRFCINRLAEKPAYPLIEPGAPRAGWRDQAPATCSTRSESEANPVGAASMTGSPSAAGSSAFAHDPLKRQPGSHAVPRFSNENKGLLRSRFFPACPSRSPGIMFLGLR